MAVVVEDCDESCVLGAWDCADESGVDVVMLHRGQPPRCARHVGATSLNLGFRSIWGFPVPRTRNGSLLCLCAIKVRVILWPNLNCPPSPLPSTPLAPFKEPGSGVFGEAWRGDGEPAGCLPQDRGDFFLPRKAAALKNSAVSHTQSPTPMSPTAPVSGLYILEVIVPAAGIARAVSTSAPSWNSKNFHRILRFQTRFS